MQSPRSNRSKSPNAAKRYRLKFGKRSYAGFGANEGVSSADGRTIPSLFHDFDLVFVPKIHGEGKNLRKYGDKNGRNNRLTQRQKLAERWWQQQLRGGREEFLVRIAARKARVEVARKAEIARKQEASIAEQFNYVEAKIRPSVYKLSPRARALLRGKEIVEADLVDAGGAYSAEEVQVLLNGITRQALQKQVKDKKLLAVPGPSNRRRYPAFQFTQNGVVPGLKDVQEALPTSNPWTILNFLVHADDRLDGRRPIDMLMEGKKDLVVSVAQDMGVQGR